MNALDPSGRTLILGHRGSPLEAPENTIRSLDLALAAGADGVELDVQVTGDRVPLVIHDDLLDRTTTGIGRVADRTLAELAGLRSRGEPIPTLEQAVRWAMGAGAWLNVEIKASGVERETVDVLTAAGAAQKVVISSFDAATVREVGRIAPHLRRFLLLEQWDTASVRLLGTATGQGVCLGVSAATPNVIREIRSADLPLIVWTADDPIRIRALLQASIAAIITNRPATAVAVRRELES